MDSAPESPRLFVASTKANIGYEQSVTSCVVGLGTTTEEVMQTSFDGFDYSTFGGATLSIRNGKPILSGLDASAAGVSVEVEGSLEGSINFDPIQIPIGRTFSTTAVDQNGREIASFELIQLDRLLTEAWVNLGDTVDRLSDDTVTLFARGEKGEEFQTIVPAKRRIFIGTVSSSTSAWAISYEWLCAYGECHLIIDPENTGITFASYPESTVPFKFLGVILKLNENDDMRISRVDLGAAATLSR